LCLASCSWSFATCFQLFTGSSRAKSNLVYIRRPT